MADLSRFKTSLPAVAQLIQALDGRGMIIGGVAVGLLSNPRATADIDALVLAPGDDPEEILSIAARFQIQPRIQDVIEFARTRRVLVLEHTPSGVPIDFSLGLLPYEEAAIGRALEMRFEGVTLRIATPEDMVVMKAIAGRLRDIGDINLLAQMYPQLDMEYIRANLAPFAELLEDDELISRMEKAVQDARDLMGD